MSVIVLEGGLGNRMRVAASALALCNAKQQPLQVLWTEQWGMRCRFDNLFCPVKTDNVVADGFSLRDATTAENIFYARPTASNLYLPALTRRLRHKHIILSPRIWHLNQVGFDFAAFLAQGNSLITAYRDFFPWQRKHLTALFRPNERVDSLIRARTAPFTSHTIGVHVRRTDLQQSIDESPLDLFIEAVDRELELDCNLTIYLATDDEATKQELFKRYGQRLFTAPDEATRDSTEGIRNAVVEMFALSYTHHIYGSSGSTFSTIAACLGNVPIDIIQRNGRGNIDLLCQDVAKP